MLQDASEPPGMVTAHLSTRCTRNNCEAPSDQCHTMHPHEYPPSRLMPIESMIGVRTSCYGSAVGMLQAAVHVDKTSGHIIMHAGFAQSRRVQEARPQQHVQRLPKGKSGRSQFGPTLAARNKQDGTGTPGLGTCPACRLLDCATCRGLLCV